MPEKKIAIIISGFQVFYLNKLISLLQAQNYQIDFYSNNPNHLSQPNTYFFDAETSENDIKIIKNFNSKLKEAMKDKKYDFVISDCIPVSFGCCIFHRHSLEYRQKLCPNFIYKFFFTFGHLKKLLFFKKWHKNEHQKIFVMSELMKKDYASAFSIPEEKIVVLRPGIISIENKNIRLKNFEKEEFILGLSAVGFSSKGGYFLLDAIRRIKNKNIKCKIIYPKFKKNLFIKFLVKIMGIQDRVEFVEFQKTMTDFYNSIDCLVVASLAEAFGRVATEAMILKTPVIMGSNIGAAEVFKDGTDSFIYDFDKTSGKNLAKKIEEVYEKRNELQQVLETAYNKAKNLSWDNFAVQLFNNFN